MGILEKIDNLGSFLLTISDILTDLSAKTVFYRFSSTFKPPLNIIFIFSFDSTITNFYYLPYKFVVIDYLMIFQPVHYGVYVLQP